MKNASFAHTLRSPRTLTSLALLAALLPVIGCSAGTESEGVASRDDALNGPDLGVDYAWARPNPGTLHSEGFRFVARYVSYDTTGKNLTKGEADELIKAGLDIVTNWEWGAQDVLDGYSKGVEEAKSAEAMAKACGAPGDRPIYFSIDFDAQPSEQGVINSYFDGVASVIGRDRTGAYGGYGPISRLFDDGKIKWGWQTYAWSNGQWDHRAQLRQVENGIGPGGGEDKDQSMVADFGQWGHGTAPPPPPPKSKPAITGSNVGINHDGRLEVFARGVDNKLYHVWQDSSGWSKWSSLGGDLTEDPIVIENEDGRLEVLARGTDNAVWHIWQKTPEGAWSGWSSLGGNVVSKLTAGRNDDGRLEVFARGTDNAIWHAWQKTAGGAWSGWSSLGGDMAGDAAVGVNEDGRLEIFARTSDGVLHHAWQKSGGGWSGWSSLGGHAIGNAAVGRNKDGRLEVFELGTDHALWHAWQKTAGGAWSGWSSLGGDHASDPSVGHDADGRLEVFAEGTDDALHHIWQNPGGGWSSWASLGGKITGMAGVGENKDGRLEVFVHDPNESMSHVWQTSPNGNWGGLSSLGGDVDQ
jgi:hypothetical protein